MTGVKKKKGEDEWICIQKKHCLELGYGVEIFVLGLPD